MPPPPRSPPFPYTTLFRSAQPEQAEAAGAEDLAAGEGAGIGREAAGVGHGNQGSGVRGRGSARIDSSCIHQRWSMDGDRKSTRLNSSHRCISYAVFCLKKK